MSAVIKFEQNLGRGDKPEGEAIALTYDYRLWVVNKEQDHRCKCPKGVELSGKSFV